ncbi:TetR/AcrR family transcriptional regulator C-terminal domain-containing protein [Nocardia sp. NPDC051570]|uniref:TetR/AcrR family transcriptional regulator C-terminal domain-containing protein n=1 Tax=Nocardia sp. NPDC051570 TaxID=3364324 RepID=UPI0037922A48
MQQEPPDAPRRRATRNSLSPAVIVTAALAVLDEEGIEAFTMRALATRLEVRPMAVYTYFRSKDELFDAVRDALLGLSLSPVEGSWQDQVRAIARRVREQILQHPFLITLLLTRPLSGRETADSAEAILRVLSDAGFNRETAARAYITLLTHVLGAASWEIQMTAVYQDPDRRSQLDTLPSSRYPTLTALAPELNLTNGGSAQFEFGLDLVLEGLSHKLRADRA